MLTLSAIAEAVANPTTDNSSNNWLIGIGILVGLFLLFGAVSSGSSAKRVVLRHHCPHCNRQIRKPVFTYKPAQRSSFAARGTRNSLRSSRSSRTVVPRSYAQSHRGVRRSNCPYCKKEIIWT